MYENNRVENRSSEAREGPHLELHAEHSGERSERAGHGQLHRIPRIPQAHEIRPLDHTAILDIQTGNNPLRISRCTHIVKSSYSIYNQHLLFYNKQLKFTSLPPCRRKIKINMQEFSYIILQQQLNSI